MTEQTVCKHCNMPTKNNGQTHVHTNLMRCDPAESGLPYGYSADLPDQPCNITCAGSRPGTDRE